MKNLTIFTLGNDVRPADKATIEDFKKMLANLKENSDNVIVVGHDVNIQFVWNISDTDLVVQ